MSILGNFEFLDLSINRVINEELNRALVWTNQAVWLHVHVSRLLLLYGQS